MKEKNLLNLESLEQRTLFAGPGDDANLVSSDLISGLVDMFDLDFVENQEVVNDSHGEPQAEAQEQEETVKVKEKHHGKRHSRFDTSDFDWFSKKKPVERPIISFKMEDYGSSKSSSSFSEALSEFAHEAGEGFMSGLKLFANHVIGIGPAKDRFNLISFVSKTLGFGENETQPISLTKALGFDTTDADATSESDKIESKSGEATQERGPKFASKSASGGRSFDWLGFI